MAAAPQEWIDSSFALLERLERERDGLASALAELDDRVNDLHFGVDQAGIALGDMHVERQRIEEARRTLAQRADDLDAAQTRLWDRLVALQNEREAIKAAEADLYEQVSSLEAREETLPERYQRAQVSMAHLESELASATRTREDIAREVASLDKEMAQMIRALESVAGSSDADFDDGETNVAPSPLRLVGSGPPPPPNGRAKLPRTEVLGGSGVPRAHQNVAPTMPIVPASPVMRTMVPQSGKTIPASEHAPTTRHNVVPLREAAMQGHTMPASAAAPMMAFAPAASMPAAAPTPAAMVAPAAFPTAVPSYIESDLSDDSLDLLEKKARRTRRRLWLGIMVASAAVVAMAIQVAPQTPWWSDIEPSVLRARHAMLAMVEDTPAAGLVPASWRSSGVEQTATAMVPEEPAVKSASLGPPPTPAPVAPEQDPTDPLAEAAAAADADAVQEGTGEADPEAPAAAPAADIAEEEAPPPAEAEAPEPEEPEAAAKAAKPAPARKSSSRRSKKSSRARKASSSKPKPAPKPVETSASPMPKKRKNGVSVTSSDDPLSGL